jgi:hypothetical protein
MKNPAKIMHTDICGIEQLQRGFAARVDFLNLVGG